MTQEEKARAYDEAIAKAQKELQTCGSTDCDAARQIYRFFPELAESEDEKIKREIKVILANTDLSQFALDYTFADMIAWLEKQGESKYIPKYKIGDYVKNTNYKGEPIYEIIYMDKECYICEYRGKERMGDKAVMHFSFDNPYLRLVQKSDDKVEPKFHEGDWIVDNNGKVAIIYDLQKAGYVGHYTNGTDFVCKYDNEHLLHLWTIADAKDGDVLHSPSHRLIWIYKDNEHYHVCINMNYVTENIATDGLIKIPSNVCPATKDEYTILFAKMKEADFEWDDTKKELKKIEQKLASSAKHYENNTLLDLLQKMPSCITVDEIDYHFVMKKTIFYKAYYEGEGEEGKGKVIFRVTAYSPIVLLTAMLEKLKKEGLLE